MYFRKKSLWLSTKMNAVFIRNIINHLPRLVNLSAKKLPDASCQPELAPWNVIAVAAKSFLSGNYFILKFIPWTSSALRLAQDSFLLQWATYRLMAGQGAGKDYGLPSTKWNICVISKSQCTSVKRAQKEMEKLVMWRKALKFCLLGMTCLLYSGS